MNWTKMSHSPMVREFGLWGWGRMWRKRADPLLNWMRHNNCLISDVLVFSKILKNNNNNNLKYNLIARLPINLLSEKLFHMFPVRTWHPPSALTVRWSSDTSMEKTELYLFLHQGFQIKLLSEPSATFLAAHCLYLSQLVSFLKSSAG